MQNKMADALTLLRQYNLQRKEITERDDLVIFDQLAWGKSTKTNYTVYRLVTVIALEGQLSLSSYSVGSVGWAAC